MSVDTRLVELLDDCAAKPELRAMVAKEIISLVTERDKARRQLDRETELRRDAEEHNAMLRKALDCKPYPDEYAAMEERAIAAERRAASASDGGTERITVEP